MGHDPKTNVQAAVEQINKLIGMAVCDGSTGGAAAAAVPAILTALVAEKDKAIKFAQSEASRMRHLVDEHADRAEQAEAALAQVAACGCAAIEHCADCLRALSEPTNETEGVK